MQKIEYYNPTKILNMKDLNNKKPAIYMVVTNRSAGKTTNFFKKSLTDFKENGTQLVLIYRYKYELNGSSDIFKDVLELFPELGNEVISASHASGLFYELILDGETLGYSISLSNPDSLKKYSPVFAKVGNAIFDEFQTETGKYLEKEVRKLQSVYLTLARGGGYQSRHVNLYMLSNTVSIMNPYFIAFGIHKRLRKETKFMKGKGWVLETTFNESSSKAIQNNSFFSAFENDDYMSYSTENQYLIDSKVFINTPKGRCRYICTIVYEGRNYGVREFYDAGVMYVSKKYDKTYPYVISFKASDHTQNTVMLTHYSYLWKNVRDSYFNGSLRFDDMQSKTMIFDILGVDLYK